MSCKYWNRIVSTLSSGVYLQGWKIVIALKHKLCYSPVPATFNQMSDCSKILMESRLSTSPDHGWDHECFLSSVNLVSSCDDHAQPVTTSDRPDHIIITPNRISILKPTVLHPALRLPKFEKLCRSHLQMTWREWALCCAEIGYQDHSTK